MNKYVKWGIIIAIILGFSVLGIYNFTPQINDNLEHPSETNKSGRQNKALNVKAIIVAEQNITDELYVSGSLLPDEEVELAFETSGKITDIYFQEGSHVKQGEILAKINDAPLQAQLKKLEVQLKLHQDRLFRQNALLEKEAVSKEAFQEAETNLATLQAEIDLVKANIEQTELRAPFDGVIGLRQVSLGSYVTPSSSVAKMAKINPLKVEFNVPERYAGILKEGNRLSFTVEGDLNQRNAKIYALDSRVDAETRTYKVRAHYDNASGSLVPGRYVNISLITREFGNALAVPSEAIVSEMGIDKVFLYRNGTAQPVEIKKGVRTDAYVQVLEGINLGDTVITTGTMQIRMGQKVTLDEVK